MTGTIKIRLKSKLDEVRKAFRIFFSFFKYLRRHRIKIAVLTVIMLLTSGFGVIMPLLVKFMVDTVVPTHNWHLFWIIMIGYLSFSVFMQGIGIYQAYITLCMRQEVRANLSSSYYRQLLRLPFAEIQQKQAGAHIFRATSDIDSVIGLVTSFFTVVVTNFISLIAAVGIMLRLNWKVTLIFIVFVPFAFLLRVWVSLRTRPLQQELRDHNESISGFLGQSISGIKVIKLFGKESAESLKYLRILRDNIRINFRMWAIQTVLGRVQWIFESGIGSFLQWWIWFLVMKQYTSLGTAMAISWYFNMIVGPFMTLAGSVQGIIGGMVPGERVLQTFQGEKERLYEGKRISAAQLKTGISFRNVSFSYDGRNKVLHDISLSLPLGAITALVGPSGSGKTTIINLICGLYSSYGGEIAINNIPISELALSSLRNLIALVPQDPFVFEATVAENIRYANLSATPHEVMQAAQMAKIHEKILELSEGYDTIIKSGKSDLSVGERQRITIARTFVRNAPIMIFDEAFSNLDTATESAIIEGMKRLRCQKTFLIVTHRLRSILFADQIIALKEGRIVEAGSPQELIDKEGAFYDWVDLQKNELKISL
jgi:ABC-type multidrug transport system fused ATPase/permease subunit